MEKKNSNSNVIMEKNEQGKYHPVSYKKNSL